MSVIHFVRPLHSLLAAGVLAALTAGSQASGAAGALDPTFGASGKASSFPGKSTSFVEQSTVMAVQPDGKAVVGGKRYVLRPGGNPAGESDFMLVRYTADGSADATFGNGGLVLTDFLTGDPATSSSWDELHAITIQKDGRILASGSASRSRFSPLEALSDPAVAVARYNTKSR